MKLPGHLIVIILLCSFTVDIVPAQFLAAGLKGGASFVKFTGDDADIFGEGPSIATKYAVGCFFAISAGNKITVRSEVYYSAKGTKYDFMGEDVTVTMNYIDIPLLFVFDASDKVGVFVGPAVGFYLNGDVEGNGESENIDSDAVNKNDVSLVFGMNIFVNRVHIDARYSLSITDWPDTGSGDVDLSARHSAIQIMLGFTL